MEFIEEDLREIAEYAPHSKTIQLLSANPLAMTSNKFKPILEKIMLSLMIKGLSDSYEFQNSVCQSVTDVMNSHNK